MWDYRVSIRPLFFTVRELWFWLFFRDDTANFSGRWKNTGARFAALAVTLLAWMRLYVLFDAWFMELNIEETWLWGFFSTADGRADSEITKSMFSLRLDKKEGAQLWFSGCFGAYRDQHGKRTMIFLSIAHLRWGVICFNILGICPWCWIAPPVALLKLIQI